MGGILATPPICWSISLRGLRLQFSKVGLNPSLLDNVNIAELELFAAFFNEFFFRPLVRGRRVLCLIDNTNAMSWLNNQTHRKPFYRILVGLLLSRRCPPLKRTFAHSAGYIPVYEYIRSEEYTLADALSRQPGVSPITVNGSSGSTYSLPPRDFGPPLRALGAAVRASPSFIPGAFL